MMFLFFLPGQSFENANAPNLDKAVHAFLFLFSTLFWCRGLFSAYLFNTAVKRPFFWAISINALFGIAVEFIQHYFIPNRSFDSWDIVADFFGIILGFVAFRIIYGPPKNYLLWKEKNYKNTEQS